MEQKTFWNSYANADRLHCDRSVSRRQRRQRRPRQGEALSLQLAVAVGGFWKGPALKHIAASVVLVFRQSFGRVSTEFRQSRKVSSKFRQSFDRAL